MSAPVKAVEVLVTSEPGGQGAAAQAVALAGTTVRLIKFVFLAD